MASGKPFYTGEHHTGDITIIFLTVNRLPAGWVEFHKQELFRAAVGAPIITIARNQLDWGVVNLVQTEYNYANVYVQLLRGAKAAQTPYIAVVEDDVLYTEEHFTSYRPPPDTFAYNMTRWGLFTWSRHPTYFWKDRVTNATLLAPRQLTIDALEERFAKYPDGVPDKLVGELGRGMVERNLGVTPRKMIEFWTTDPIVTFNHKYALDHLQTTRRKAMWFVQAYDVPYWGRSEDLAKHFK